MADKKDIDTLSQGVPYLRSGIALLIYLFRPMRGVEECYSTADDFLTRLTADVEKS